MDKFQTIESFVEFYEPYLKNYCFDGTVFSNIIEKQKINPDKDFIQKAIKELRKTITNIIVNSTAQQNRQEDPSIMQYVYGFVEYSKLHERLNLDEYMRYVKDENTGSGNPHPTIFRGVDNTNFEKFDYLFNELPLNDRTKLSVLYRFFKEGNLLQPTMNQAHYISWCKKTYRVEFSKIFQLNYKTKDSIKKTIPSLLSNFKKSL